MLHNVISTAAGPGDVLRITGLSNFHLGPEARNAIHTALEHFESSGVEHVTIGDLLDAAQSAAAGDRVAETNITRLYKELSS